MPSTRLTNSSRIAITCAAVNHRFAPMEKQLAEVEEKLYAEVRASKFRFGALATIESIPAGWLPLSSRIRVDENNHLYELRTAHPQPVPADDSHAIKAAGISKRLLERVKKHCAKRVAIKDERAKLYKELRTSLDSFATLESLLKKWPELEPFTKSITPAASNLPAIPREQINKALGIAA